MVKNKINLNMENMRKRYGDKTSSLFVRTIHVYKNFPSPLSSFEKEEQKKTCKIAKNNNKICIQLELE